MTRAFLVLFALLWSSMAPAYDVFDKELPDRYFDRARARIFGFVQPRFRFVPDDPDAGTRGEVGFSVQRARFEFGGDLFAPKDQHWGISISHLFSIELVPEPRLVDAFLNLKFADELQLTVGQFKAPIHRGILVSDQNNLFADRNRVVSFVPDREIGAMIHGYWGRRFIEWQLALFNGDGPNRLDNINRKFLYVGRVVFSPWGTPGSAFEILKDWRWEGDDRWRPVFSVGYSIHFNVDGPPGQEEAWIGNNAELFFHWRFLTAMSEFFYKVSDYQDPVLPDYRQYGGYLQVGAFLQGIPWLEDHVALMGRIEQANRFQALRVDVPVAGPLDPNQEVRNYSMGVGIYAGKPFFNFVQEFRLVASYTIREELGGFPYKNNEFNVSTNLTF